MIELTAVPATVQATLLVGVVLLEAVVFYVGYGALESAVGSAIFEAIGH